MSSEIQKPLVANGNQVTQAEPKTGKEKVKACFKRHGKKCAFYGSIVAFTVFCCMWLLQFFLSGIYYWGCKKGVVAPGDYTDGDCDVTFCNTDDFPSTAHSRSHGPVFNIMHQVQLLKEADHSIWGSGFEVYDTQGETNDPRGAPVGKWWRKWGPWFTTYYYQEAGGVKGRWPKVVYMRKKLISIGDTYMIGRCDELYEPYLVTEGGHWMANLFVPLSFSGKGLQYDVVQYTGDQFSGDENATMIETSNRNSFYILQNVGNGDDERVASANQHVDTGHTQDPTKQEWNVESKYTSDLPYYVPNAMTLVLAFADLTAKEKAARKAKKDTRAVRRFHVQPPANAEQKIKQVELELAQRKQAITQLRG